jgi:pimeloyl-ACP methyl ester carboxylesterase
MRRLFVPGYGAPPAIYSRALDARWSVQTPPSFARSNGRLDAHVAALVHELASSDEPATVAGHSMGAAVAVLAALERPEAVSRLILIAPAGLPLTKPLHRSLRDFTTQLCRGGYPLLQTALATGSALRAPRAAIRLAHAIRTLDLTSQLRGIAALAIPCAVVACATDTLTPAGHCRQIARLADGRYEELELPGGHVWMLTERASFASVLA